MRSASLMESVVVESHTDKRSQTQRRANNSSLWRNGVLFLEIFAIWRDAQSVRHDDIDGAFFSSSIHPEHLWGARTG